MLHTTPRAVIPAPPSSITFPPLFALYAVISVTGRIFIEANSTGSSFSFSMSSFLQPNVIAITKLITKKKMDVKKVLFFHLF
jgi:hypothetical protein